MLVIFTLAVRSPTTLDWSPVLSGDETCCAPETAQPEWGIGEHHDAVEAHHAFSALSFNGTDWDLSHLRAFVFRIDPGLKFEVDVIVLFSCHCFTHKPESDPRSPDGIPANEIFDDGRERRVLNEERYLLFRKYLPQLIKELPSRTIQIASSGARNFMTFEFVGAAQKTRRYAVFFEVERDRRRKRRMLLRVQSAYAIEDLTHRQKKAGKVRFNVLLCAAYDGRGIRG